ncbi:TonB-dependent siderophore receptor [Pseudomonas sp. ABC1]|uniref:TonB-dependent siderophore receptor n=1 Tax=Pseudomonas sp. ABC1 TaxID=2748080 RepID=UPI0015C375C8|nr:TonB-dependent receptor [Pseudomonas sp. ABC1]QLF93756.1 TonB-dependent siderophore receptor [Pseudomonas sp. ABC1]
MTYPRLLRLGALAFALQLATPALADDALFELNQPSLPLDRALTELAARTGDIIGADASLLSGHHAPSLKGRYSTGQALQQLLRDSGLYAIPIGEGRWSIQPLSAPGSAMELGATSITGQGLQGLSTTEGTGSYTSGSSNSATKLNLSLRETPQSISVMTRQRIEDQNLSQLTDVIRQTPGLSVSANAGGGSSFNSIYSRGFTVENFQVDGERLLNSGYSGIFQSADMVLYDRVEVIRGATGLMSGAGLPGATVNMVRKRPTDTFKGSVNLKAGSWDHQRGEVDVGGPLNASGSVRARLVGAYQENDSFVERLHERKKILYGLLEADLTPGTLLTVGADIQHHDANEHAQMGLPLFNKDGSQARWSRSDSAAASWAYSNRHFVSAFSSLEQRLSENWKAKLTLNRARYDYDEMLGFANGGSVDPATGQGVTLYIGQWQAKPVQTGLDLNVNGSFEWFGREHDAVFGYSHQRTRYKSNGYPLWYYAGWVTTIDNIYQWDGKTPGQPVIPATSRTSQQETHSAGYASVRLRATDDLSVILGARVSDWKDRADRTNLVNGAVTHTRRGETGVLTPYIGLVQDLDEHWSVYASYTSIFKPQSRRTLEGSYIDPLEGVSYEIGSKAAFLDDRLNLAIALYQIEQDNLAVSLVGQSAPDGSQAYRSESGTKTRGLELELSGELTTNWQASASFSRNIVQDSKGKALNTNIPQNTLKLFTRYELRGIGNGLTVGGGVNWQSEIFNENAGPARVRFSQEDYAVVDAFARYPLTSQLTATLNLNNLLDEKYYASTGSSYYGTPRNATLGLRMEF